MRILISLALLAGLAGSARAEPCRQEDDSPPTTRVEMIDGKRVMVIEKTIVVCGHPARPGVVYVTDAKDVEYTWTQLAEDLAGKIVESVKQLGGKR